jgi:hypothetical protein
MANTVIQLRNSTVTGNVPSSLANGEISINSRDGKFFYSTPAGVVVTHYPYPGPSGLNQEIQFNDSGVLGSDSGLSYNKTTDVLTVVGGAIIGGVNVTPQIQLAFTQANTPSHVANSAASYANSAFTRANNSLDANNGGTVTGTITATSFITTGSFGNILGANTIYANNFVANTGFIQFSDGTRQFTANAGSGGGTDTFARDTANAAFLKANTPSHVANSAAIYANGAFAAANSATATNTTQNNSIAAAFATANASFIAANAATATNTTQNNSITAAFASANAAFTRANNSVNANTGGSITGDISITGNLTVDTNTLYIDAVNNEVGIGTTTPAYKLEVNGSFAATTKSFVITHPTKDGMKLRYGSLEGPENGVYIRGRTKENIIELPEYWTKLVDSESITVNLTPIGNHQNLFVEKIKDNKIYIKNNNVLNRSVDCFYIVFAERIDVDKLKVEYAV